MLTFQYLITLIKRLPICNNYFQMFLSWGNARSELVKGEDRTLENISQPHQDWVMNTGGDRKKKLLEHYNVEFLPLLTSHSSETSLLLKLPPPPLHCFRLGPVNHLI